MIRAKQSRAKLAKDWFKSASKKITIEEEKKKKTKKEWQAREQVRWDTSGKRRQKRGANKLHCFFQTGWEEIESAKCKWLKKREKETTTTNCAEMQKQGLDWHVWERRQSIMIKSWKSNSADQEQACEWTQIEWNGQFVSIYFQLCFSLFFLCLTLTDQIKSSLWTVQMFLNQVGKHLQHLQKHTFLFQQSSSFQISKVSSLKRLFATTLLEFKF